MAEICKQMVCSLVESMANLAPRCDTVLSDIIAKGHIADRNIDVCQNCSNIPKLILYQKIPHTQWLDRKICNHNLGPDSWTQTSAYHWIDWAQVVQHHCHCKEEARADMLKAGVDVEVARAHMQACKRLGQMWWSRRWRHPTTTCFTWRRPGCR